MSIESEKLKTLYHQIIELGLTRLLEGGRKVFGENSEQEKREKAKRRKRERERRTKVRSILSFISLFG